MLKKSRRFLAAIAILLIFADAIWLWQKTQPPEFYFVFETSQGGLDKSDLAWWMEDLENPVLPLYRNGQWTNRGRLVSDLRPFVHDKGYADFSSRFVITYRLASDATIEDFARSSEDVFALGPVGAMAYIPEAYTSANFSGAEGEQAAVEIVQLGEGWLFNSRTQGIQ